MKQEFGKRIRDLREDMDLNQTKLGKEVNMTQRKIENGTYEPSIDDIISFCKFFNVSSDYLLGLKDSTK